MRKTKRKAKKPSTPKHETETDLAARIQTPPTDGNNIRNWRLYRKIATHQELAKLSGVGRGTICRLESGECRYNQTHIDLLAKALRCSPRDLIGTNPLDSGDIFAVYAGLDADGKDRLRALMRGLK